MKNQYNVIKEKLEQGFFVLVKERAETQYCLYTENSSETLWSSGWTSVRDKATSIENIRSDYDTAYLINSIDLEIVEYFRPNDLFPSKRFEAGDRVEVKLTNWSTDPRREVLSVALTKDWVVESIDAHSGNVYYTLYSTSQGNTCYLSALHVYPRIEKQEDYMLCPVCGKSVDHINDVYTSEIQKQNWDGVTKTERFHTDCYKTVEEKRAINLIVPQEIQKALEDAGWIITKK